MAEYPDFEKACGYGDVQGIGGANCRHSFHPFIEGVSERAYTDAQLESMKPENRPKVKFEGREYDDYEATRKQRQIESAIRHWKRRAAGAVTEKDKDNANIRIRRLNEKYEAFSRAAGLPEQRERMRVLENSKASSHVLESDAGDAVRRAAKSMVNGEKVVGFDGLPKEMRRSFREGLVKATPEAKAVLRKIYRQTDYVVSGEKRSYYARGLGKNVVYIGTNAKPSTLAHELFHKLDKNYKISRAFTKSLGKDRAALNAMSGGDIKGYFLREFPKMFSRMSETGEPLMDETYRGIADILNGFSGGRVYYGYGHPENYWSDPWALETEAWAQFGRVQYENNDDVLEMFEKVLPHFYKSAIIALRRLM